MTPQGLRLRHLVFHGPGRRPAAVNFGPGMNVIYGASETGKSFIVEAIDFMLGGHLPLRDITERVGYDLILLGLETLSGEQYTLARSVEGGRYRAYNGLHTELPENALLRLELSDQHSEKASENLSMFLLEKCALSGKRIRANNRGKTNSLSFRLLARLMIVTETEITSQRSPLKDGNPIADTPNFATFKLLLTGTDDSTLLPEKPRSAEDQSREAQLELLEQLIAEHRMRVRELAKAPAELEDQESRLNQSLAQHMHQLATTESEYRDLQTSRRELRRRLEEGEERRAEIESLLERFALLARHYESDIARLRGIEEAGTFFGVLAQTSCPLCGADPQHQQQNAECDGNVDAVVVAARAELAKIELLQGELGDTVKDLRNEMAGFNRKLPRIEEKLNTLSEKVSQLVRPLTQLRATYAELADKKASVREALGLYRTLRNLEDRRDILANSTTTPKGSSISDGDLPTAVAERFAQTVQRILEDWHFPESERVFFDAKTRDLVIAGKQRVARGKGLRAITHAAFTVGLLKCCRDQGTPHPGFVVLDSPLLTYRAPEGPEDDLRGTDLKERFYAYLTELPRDRQVIIIENIDPPLSITARPDVIMFSKNPHAGRYGFFPMDPVTQHAASKS